MVNEMERRLRIVAQIANYGAHLGLLPFQIDEAVRIGISQLDAGRSCTTANQAGRRAVDQFVRPPVRLQARYLRPPKFFGD